MKGLGGSDDVTNNTVLAAHLNLIIDASEDKRKGVAENGAMVSTVNRLCIYYICTTVKLALGHWSSGHTCNFHLHRARKITTAHWYVYTSSLIQMSFATCLKPCRLKISGAQTQSSSQRTRSNIPYSQKDVHGAATVRSDRIQKYRY